MHLCCSHSCPLIPHAAPATDGNTTCLCPGRWTGDYLSWSDRCLFHGFALDEPPCSPTSADTISGSPLSFLSFLAQSWISWKRALISAPSTWEEIILHRCLLSIAHFWHPGLLLAVAFLCAIRCSSKQRISFVCSNTLMTSQSILPYSFIRNWENACYLFRPEYCGWWVCLFSI